MPSTPLGIVYPASTDAVDVPGDLQRQALSVDALLAAQGQWQAFTPVYSAGVASIGGSAENEGWFSQIGQLVFWGFRTQFGSAPSITTIINLNLPVPAYQPGSALSTVVGTWRWRTAVGPSEFAGAIGLFTNNGTGVSFSGAWNGTNPGVRMGSGSTAALSVAVNDVLAGSGCYRAA